MAINPFQDLPIYTPQMEKLYHDTVKSAAPPHIYAIADQAYHSLVRNSKNQCAVIRFVQRSHVDGLFVIFVDG